MSAVSPIYCKSVELSRVAFRFMTDMHRVWDYAKREARFIEVKGPGDSLSETQKVWIDVLLSAGIQVEVCKVKAKDVDAPLKKRKRFIAKKEETMSIDIDNGVEEGRDEKEPGEFDYESGDEGKGEGRWEKRGRE